uniref:(northern house mosquito) hypothetical protein n=1 Tax=Culex pipiens TaxID=7175 RepID=A0A8D8P369_CULPI
MGWLPCSLARCFSACWVCWPAAMEEPCLRRRYAWRGWLSLSRGGPIPPRWRKRRFRMICLVRFRNWWALQKSRVSFWQSRVVPFGTGCALPISILQIGSLNSS